MKKHIFYLFLVSAMLTLGACSSESAEDSSNDFEALEEEELETDKGAAFDWLGLTEEEKETMVVDSLNEAGYSGFPTEPLITSLDEAYSSGFNMDEDFKTVFGYMLNNFQEPQMINSGDQYGNDTFTDKNYSAFHVAEKEGRTFVVHGPGFLGMLYSYAKDGVWVEKDIPLFTSEKINSILQSEGLNPEIYDLFNEKIIYDNDRIYVLLRDKRPYNPGTVHNHVLLHFSLTEEGVVENGVTQGLPFAPPILKTNKNKLAMILDNQTTDMKEIVYLEDKEKQPIKTYQESDAFRNRFSLSTNTVDRIYYYEDTGLMLVGDDKAYYLDTNTGEPVWNASGQEDEYDFYIRDSVVHFYNEHTMAIAYGDDNTFNLYGELLNPKGVGVSLPFDIEGTWFSPEFWVTSNETSYTVWKTHKFKGKPALQFATIQKGIGAYHNTAN